MEARDVPDGAGGGVLGVPIAGDLHRVGLVQHRGEDRLVGQPRREGPEPARRDQFQLGLAGRKRVTVASAATLVVWGSSSPMRTLECNRSRCPARMEPFATIHDSVRLRTELTCL